MENSHKNVLMAAIGAFALVLIMAFYSVASIVGQVMQAPGLEDTSSKLGGLVHNTQETFDAGIAVNGTEVISSSRGISAAGITGTTGSFSSTLDVTGATTLSSTLKVGGQFRATSTALFTGAVTHYAAVTDESTHLFKGQIRATSTALFTGAVTDYSTLTVVGQVRASSTSLFTGAMTGYSTLNLSGLATLTGGAKFGTGTKLTNMLSASSSVDYAALGAGACSSSNMTLTGATVDDAVSFAFPNSVASLTSTTQKVWVSAANTITRRHCNYGSATTSDPAAGIFRVMVFKFY